MKNKIIIIVVVLAIILGTILIYFLRLTPIAPKPNVHSMDEKGIYIGTGKSGLESASNERSNFAKTVQGLNEGWDNIGTGESYYRAGRYEEAIKAFKKAYDVDPGNRTLSGDKLIKAYEKLARYDEAIVLVDDILKNQPLGEYGIEQFTAIRARLLAAKTKNSGDRL